MGYIESNLLRGGERIVSAPERSKVRLVWAWVLGVLFFWCFFLPLVRAIRETRAFPQTEYAVTDQRVLIKCGWPKDMCKEKPWHAIERIECRQSFWGKRFHYGTLTFVTVDRNNLYFVDVKDADAIAEKLNALICG